ncbi:MAG: response regulator [Pseudomonadota bacterium]
MVKTTTRCVPSSPTDLPVSILLVDDEPRNLLALETVLADPSYRLVRAESGKEALLALMQNEFAVLVLDVRMPDMTGFELAHMVKEREKTAQIPIIFLTAYYGEDQHILEGYTSGAVDYLHKPVNPAVLRSKVAVFADLHRKSLALEITNAALVAEITERRSAESRLSELNTSLDRRVKERTQALHASEVLLQDASRRKDEFLATLAHELRNPLAPVRNAVQVLRLKGSMAPEAQWASEIIDRQVHAMSRLIDDLMDAARVNQGKIDVRLERVELAQVLRDAVEACRPFMDACAHQLSMEMHVQPVWINADPIRLAQAFTNLLHNAAKYMDHKGRIEVSVRHQYKEVLVSIKDYGIGIAARRLRTIFDMFSQVESTLERSRGGLGIGLALTQRLVELHRGSVKASSPGLGRGSEFVVRLPLADSQEMEQATESHSAPSLDTVSQPANRELRILIADDNEDSAATLAFLLEMMGHVVHQVYDGEAAIREVALLDPHLVLLDIGMPKLNGYEACRRIRDLPSGKGRTIVAVTGWGQPGDRQVSKQAGFDKHLVKPLALSELEEVIAGLIASKPQAD